jgi:hypothetical protein
LTSGPSTFDDSGKRSSRLGALTPEWRSPRGGSRCGRAKSRYERWERKVSGRQIRHSLTRDS